ncbi:MAG: hypothetical protein D6702_00830 [Planctomycetota bacterium]|nr:MAG: hypothetical protein D6702_00830 [Planctomycetota bacterium]
MPSPPRSGAGSTPNSPAPPPEAAGGVPAATGRRYAAGVAAQVLGRSGQAAAAFVVLVLLARELPRAALGVFGVYETLFAFSEVLVDFGSGNALVRRAGAQPAVLAPALGAAVRFRLATAAAAAALVAAFAAFDPLVPAGHPGLLVCIACLGAHLATPRTVVFQLRLRFGPPAAVRAVSALAGLGAVAAALAGGVRDPLWLLAGIHLARAAGSLALAALAGRPLRRWRRDAGAAPGPGPDFARECLALGAGALAREGYNRLDLLLVRAFLGAAAAGVYTPVRKVFLLALQLPAFVGTVAMPALAARAGRPAELRRACFRLAGRAALVALPAAALAWPLAPMFVALAFGSGFAAAAGPLQILAVAAALVYPGSLLTTGLVAAGAAREALGLALLVLVLAAAAGISLIPAAGLAGAAWARLAAEAAALAGAFLLLRRRSRTAPPR